MFGEEIWIPRTVGQAMGGFARTRLYECTCVISRSALCRSAAIPRPIASRAEVANTALRREAEAVSPLGSIVNAM